MRRTSLELELKEAKEALDSLKQAYSSDSWNDSVKESYGKLLTQQQGFLERLDDYVEAMRGTADDFESLELDKLVDLAKKACAQAEDIE